MARSSPNPTTLLSSRAITIFRPKRSDSELFKPSETTSVCPWKGTANYHSLAVDGKENPDAAWYYADPKEAAANIKGRIAFWKGVEVG